MRRWQKALSSADNWITRLSTGNARQRVARLLLLLDEAPTDDSFFLPTREDMGAMLGITTESANKVTADFRRRGWLRPLGGHRAWIDARVLQEEVDWQVQWTGIVAGGLYRSGHVPAKELHRRLRGISRFFCSASCRREQAH